MAANIRLHETYGNVPPFDIPSFKVPVAIDWVINQTGIDETQALATAIICALNSDKLAFQDDPLPDKWFDNDRRGWWGDMDAAQIWNGWPFGSRLWTKKRDKIVFAQARGGSTAAQIALMISECIQPFVTLRIISGFAFEITKQEIDRIETLLTLYRPMRPNVTIQYDYVWDEIGRNI